MKTSILILTMLLPLTSMAQSRPDPVHVMRSNLLSLNLRVVGLVNDLAYTQKSILLIESTIKYIDDSMKSQMQVNRDVLFRIQHKLAKISKELDTVLETLNEERMRAKYLKME